MVLIKKLVELKLNFNDIFVLLCYYYNREDLLDEFDNTKNKVKNKELQTSKTRLKLRDYLISNLSNTSLAISVKGTTLLMDLEEMVVNDEKRQDIEKGDKLSTIMSTPLNGTVEDSSSNSVSVTNITLDNYKDFDGYFEEWWKLYPTTGSWSYHDSNNVKKSFISSRNLKTIRKEDARKKYFKILNSGVEHKKVINALKYEIKLKKLDSIKTNSNKMEYFKGMESYLNQERYNIYGEMYLNNPGFVDTEELIINKINPKNITDI